MTELIKQLSLLAILTPLVGSLIAGLLGRRIGVRSVHALTIALMIVSFACSLMLFKLVVLDDGSYDGTIYRWATSGTFHFDVGFLIDRLTVLMMVVVTFVSLLVHIYSIGYMRDD
ncbi:MAG TPA: NADH-quinone oxidoreductase subunit L, partial [Coxiellaceae bacterium]|nr:NADH-quinone oxidoreductase subunit L [Coxiellaceae bacterium]